MSEFTKGEWLVLPEEVNRDYIRIRGSVLGGKYKIANVCCLKDAPTSDANEARANARLIAAAPSLYEALKDLLNLLSPTNESANESFERTAAAFYHDTGMLAPGKDSREGPSYDERFDAFVSWRNEKILNARAALSRAEGKV